MDFVITKFVSRVPVLFDIKGCLVLMLALVYISKSFHAILSFALANGYDNVQVCTTKNYCAKVILLSSLHPFLAYLQLTGILSIRQGGGSGCCGMENGSDSAGIQRSLQPTGSFCRILCGNTPSTE